MVGDTAVATSDGSPKACVFASQLVLRYASPLSQYLKMSFLSTGVDSLVIEDAAPTVIICSLVTGATTLTNQF